MKPTDRPQKPTQLAPVAQAEHRNARKDAGKTPHHICTCGACLSSKCTHRQQSHPILPCPYCETLSDDRPLRERAVHSSTIVSGALPSNAISWMRVKRGNSSTRPFAFSTTMTSL